MSDLTPKQEAFCLAYLETGNAAGAYRSAYDVEENARDSWIYVEAVQLLDNPKITIRLKELRSRAEDLSIFNVHAAHEQYEEARALAMSQGLPSAAVSAVAGKVKLFGLEMPKRVELTGKGGGPVRTEEVSPRELLVNRINSIAARDGTSGDDGGSDG